jgi:hypothetical protein
MSKSSYIKCIDASQCANETGQEQKETGRK